MNNKSYTITNQLQRNAVALISLIIALSSLGYTTWRNEKTEDNRNQRYAAFEILSTLNELQLVVFHRRYDRDLSDKGNARVGWTYALTINDLAQVLPPPLPEQAKDLLHVWENNWEHLEEQAASADALTTSMDNMRATTLTLLKALE